MVKPLVLVTISGILLVRSMNEKPSWSLSQMIKPVGCVTAGAGMMVMSKLFSV